MEHHMAIEKDLLDQLLAGRDPKDVFNKDGLVDELKKALSERILNTELDEHLDSDGAGTWAMTLVIQRAEHRDTQAIHAKLDEILHALGASEMKSRGWMRNREPEEIEQRREHMRKDD
jgi:hypothetical protein